MFPSDNDLLVAPLMTKDGLDTKAHEIMKSAIDIGIDAYYDEAGSIGRRYARADEIGIFYSMTIDHQTLDDKTVTLRNRDSMKQERIKIEHIKNLINEEVSLRSILKKL